MRTGARVGTRARELKKSMMAKKGFTCRPGEGRLFSSSLWRGVGLCDLSGTGVKIFPFVWSMADLEYV